MPYYRDGLCVYKRDTGEKVGCSDTVAGAERYLRKLRMVQGQEGKAMDGLWLTTEQVRSVCVGCADEMATKGIDRVNVAELSDEQLRVMFKANLDTSDPGFFTACMDNPDIHGDDKEALCAYLHHRILGTWPAEKSLSDKMMMRPTQGEAQYVTLSGEAGKACANCRWFSAAEGGGYCHLIENYPEDILPTGYCSRWEGKPAPEEPAMATIQADSVLVLPPMEMGSMARSEDKAGRVLSKRNAGKITSALMAIKDVLLNAGLVNMDDMPDAMDKGMFTVFKANGKDYWKAIWTNNFKDLEGEILSEAAHDRYLARVEKHLVPMPELWYWHIPGTKHGQALWLGRADHLMLAVGDFDDTPLAQAFIKSYRKSREKVSHGFRFPTWAKQNGVYLDYNTFELSPLPPDAAANPYTGFEGSIDMAISEAQRAKLEQILGKDKAAEIIGNAEQTSKQIEKSGAVYKDFADVPAAEQAAKAKSADDAESKALNALMVALEGQGELIKRQEELEAASKGYALKFEALEKAQAEQKAANEALAKENAELREKMRMTPRASQNEKTAVTDEQLQKTMEDRVGDYDEAWKALGLKVPKKGVGNNG